MIIKFLKNAWQVGISKVLEHWILVLLGILYATLGWAIRNYISPLLTQGQWTIAFLAALLLVICSAFYIFLLRKKLKRIDPKYERIENGGFYRHKDELTYHCPACLPTQGHDRSTLFASYEDGLHCPTCNKKIMEHGDYIAYMRTHDPEKDPSLYNATAPPPQTF